ncbi:hypothetical protein JQX13_06125 [Archangium violaceum]|uniref:Hint domain-containing protein n=1 Tax=Archangium violaceum TaxID=83451 RepID=UPI00193BA56A|nr:Hint domain-containing protein [Archangium violaceum]QRK09699.1 hypothetical protein JQX13_06125 [Archangium violaceum]
MRIMFVRLIVVAAFSISSSAWAQVETRCFQDDQILYPEQAVGRNAWARKCGYINAARETAYNSFGDYVIFASGCHTYPNHTTGTACTFRVPVSEAEPCLSFTPTYLGTCMVGCYTGTEEVRFGEKYWPIAEAPFAGLSTVTALTQNATLARPEFSEQPIRTFVAGDTVEDIFVLETVDGRRVEVTSEHPMVNGDGIMVRARTLKAGDVLLGVDGQKVELSQVSVFRYTGKVWNVQPVSKVKMENVLDVEGLMTGSVRFQNEWSQDYFRLSVREDADVSGL